MKAGKDRDRVHGQQWAEAQAGNAQRHRQSGQVDISTELGDAQPGTGHSGHRHPDRDHGT